MIIETAHDYFNKVAQGNPGALKNVTEIFYKTNHIDNERYLLYYKKDRIPGISFKTPHFLEITRDEFYFLTGIIEYIKIDLVKRPLYQIPSILHVKPFSIGKFLCFYTYRSIDEEGEDIIHFSPYKNQIIIWVNEWIESIEKNPKIWNTPEELDHRIHLAEKIIYDIKSSL